MKKCRYRLEDTSKRRLYLASTEYIGVLARMLDVESEGRLGESGYRLLGVWRDEKLCRISKVERAAKDQILFDYGGMLSRTV